jgi:hypothetical protein
MFQIKKSQDNVEFGILNLKRSRDGTQSPVALGKTKVSGEYAKRQPPK